MRLLRNHGFLLLALGAMTSAGTAGATTAQLQGRVTDENALPVAGVAVVLRSPDETSQVVYSDEAGLFEIQSLSPGDFLVDLTKAGFFRMAHQPIQLKEGKNLVSFTLSHEFELHETVEVTASPGQIQPAETTHEETLEAHDILNIASNKTHDLGSYLSSLPGVFHDNSGELHIAGGRGGETEYLLNGFEIGDPATGELTGRVNVDTVRVVAVASGSYGAEYPHAGTGVMELQTYSGDDRWRFGTTNFLPGFNFQQGLSFGNWFPRFTFSGPIRKSRAWFSEAVSAQHTFDLIKDLPRDANTVSQWGGDNLFRIQINLTPRHVLQGDFLTNWTRASHLGLSPFFPLSMTTNLRAARYFVSVKDQISLKDSLVELGAAVDRGHSDRLPQGNFFESLHQQTTREQLIANWIIPSRRWHGMHDVKAGLNADRLTFSQQAARNPIEILGAGQTFLHYTTFVGAPEFSLSNTQAGLYAQDAWRFWRPLLIQAGVRTDWDQVVHRALLEPRLAANWLPFRDDRAKLTLAWGIYYQPISLALWGQALDQQRVDVFSNGGSANTGDIPVLSRFLLPPQGLKQPRFHTTSLEWRQRIGDNTLLGIHWMRRNQFLGLAYENFLSGEYGNEFVLQNHRRDRYRSVDVSLRHSFPNQAEVFAHYTRSSARSNEVLDYSLETLYYSAQAPGPLAWDAPNRFLSWGWMPTPIWRLLFNYSVEYRTGFPFSLFNQKQQLIGPPNQLRFPAYCSLDLGIEKRFHIGNHEWAVRVVAINLTDRPNPNAVNNIAGGPRVFGRGQGRAFTGRLRLVGRK